MDIFQSIIGARLVFIFAITNLVTALLVLASCRCIPMAKLTQGFTKNKVYQRFFKWHCYIWWAFWTSVVIHAIFAIARLGVPF